MKHIKLFNESNKILPKYTKGEILIFTSNEDEDFMRNLLKKSNIKLIGPWEYSDDTYIVETPIGKENLYGQFLLDDYPEFIDGYERRDLNLEYIYTQLFYIRNLIDEAEDLLSHKKIEGEGQFGELVGTKFPDAKPFNDKIDEIIDKLKSIKQ